jgi:hypothetical protein
MQGKEISNKKNFISKEVARLAMVKPYWQGKEGS